MQKSLITGTSMGGGATLSNGVAAAAVATAGAAVVPLAGGGRRCWRVPPVPAAELIKFEPFGRGEYRSAVSGFPMVLPARPALAPAWRLHICSPLRRGVNGAEAVCGERQACSDNAGSRRKGGIRGGAQGGQQAASGASGGEGGGTRRLAKPHGPESALRRPRQRRRETSSTGAPPSAAPGVVKQQAPNGGDNAARPAGISGA